MFSSSDDSAMMKQIQSTHCPDGREVDVKPIIHIIEYILHRVTPSIDGVLNGTNEHVESLDDMSNLAVFDGMLEALASIIQKVSCEISCKCSGGGDAHGTTMALFHTLSNYSWDAKVVLTLAAFSVIYGEFWLIVQLYTTNSLAKSVALLKQLPDILEHSNMLKPQFDALNHLIKAMMDVTKCIVAFTELPPHYISSEAPPLSIALAHIPIAAYWTIRSVVACASLIASLVGLRHEYISSTTEAWELSSLAHKLISIHDHLQKQLVVCHQHIDEKRHIEAYNNISYHFTIPHMDNMKILRLLINGGKDDIQALLDGTTKTKVHIEVLRRKQVLLLISDLDLSHEEILILDQMYRESRGRHDASYEVVWLPIVDRTRWNEEHERKFLELQALMPWHSINHPFLVDSAVIRYIKEAWHFAKKAIIVSLDPQGKVTSLNALHMLWIWGNLAFPFTSEREEALWKAEAWRLELVIDGIDPAVLDWMAEGRYICLYGGENIDWIRKFTTATKSVVKAAGISMEIVYAGKSNARERVRKITQTISEENLSHYWPNTTSIWFFWARLESMLFSKMQHGKTVESDHIMKEVVTVLSFDGSEQGWALFWKGSTEVTRAMGDTALNSMMSFEEWQADAREHGFFPTLDGVLKKLASPHHCNRLILPGTSGGIPEMVVCAECSRPMEMYFMYRCCVD